MKTTMAFLFSLAMALLAAPLPLLAQSASPYAVSKILDQIFNVNRSPDLVLLSAHRGSWEVYPENSALALSDAFDKQIETIEVDVRFTSDNKTVLAHDYKLDRVSTGSGLLYNTPLSQVLKLNTRDRRGHVYTAPNGKSVPMLTFAGALDVLSRYTTADGHGYVMIVDVKGAVDSDDPTDPLALVKACIQELAARNNSRLSQAVVFKLKSKDAGTRPTFESATGWTTASAGGLIVVLSPDDSQIKTASYNPANDSFLRSWQGASYRIQFEMNQFYKGDGLQGYFAYFNDPGKPAPRATATYQESNYFPEGVANSAGACCFGHQTDPAASTGGFIIPDYRGDPEMAIVNGSNLITTDVPDSVGEMLSALGKRNVNRLKF